MRENQDDGDSLLHPENLVWLPVENVFGFIVGRMGAYYTTVRYTKGGMIYEVLMENDDFELMEGPIGYDDE